MKRIFNTILSFIIFSFLFSHNGNLVYSSTKTVVELTRKDILKSQSKSYSKKVILRWNSYRRSKKDVHDGNIPVSLLNDPVYCSMNLPSESRSDEMISAFRDNGHVTCKSIPSAANVVLNFGAVEVTSNQRLPKKFTVYLGKMKMFAYSKSKKKWITIDSQPYPRGIYIYTLPWSNTKSTKCRNVTYSGKYAKVELNSKDLRGNCLHFWGKSAPIDKNDYLYYAASYDIRVSKNVVGKVTASGGIDAKNLSVHSPDSAAQLYSSRGYRCTSHIKAIWGNTIPNSKYKKLNSSVLKKMYKSK